MALRLLPLPASEDHIFMKVCWAAFRDGIMSCMYPTGYGAAAQAHSVASLARRDAQYPGRTLRFKIVDTSLPADDSFSSVIAVSEWQIFPKRDAEARAAERAWATADDEQYGSPEGLNLDFIEVFQREMRAMKDRHLGEQAFVYLHILATRPGFQRRGAGALAMQWGTEQADKLGLPAYIESSPQGVGLYSKWGFKKIDHLPLDARDWGHQDELEHTIMLREPITVDQ